jgi:predicted metalloprotease with PDZ domain
MISIRILAVAIASFLLAGASKPTSRAPADYELSPEIRDGQLQALAVTLKLRAGPQGRVLLELPQANVAVTDVWRYVRDFRVDGAIAVSAPKPSERLIEARPGAPLTVTYRVVSAYDHDPQVAEANSYTPLIRPTRFWAYGETLFAYPTDTDTATFRWTGAPAGFGFASDLERPDNRPMPMDALIESVSVGGPDLKVYQRDLGGVPLRVAILGKFDFSDEMFIETAMKVIAGERAFWRGKEGPFLAVAASFPPRGGVSIHGEGRTDAFAIQASSDTPVRYFKGLLAHEYFHNWNAGRLGGIHGGDAEPADYWFSEGFTDFYARRLTLRSGLYDLGEFVSDWNGMLQDYAASPVRAAPPPRTVADHWKTMEMQKVPYQRGAILAAVWDRELRARSGGRVGLDDLMHAMRDRAAALGARTPKSPQLFITTARSFGLDVRPDLARFVEKGGVPVLPADAFGGCVTVAARETLRYERGYGVETKDGVRLLTKVDPASAAYAAGLREGMALRRVSGDFDDLSKPFKVTVAENGRERVISYVPAARATVTAQQLEVPKDLSPAGLDACAKAVAEAR